MPTIVGRCGIYTLKNNQNKFGILTIIGWLVIEKTLNYQLGN
jgi:hypothetical protein